MTTPPPTPRRDRTQEEEMREALADVLRDLYRGSAHWDHGLRIDMAVAVLAELRRRGCIFPGSPEAAKAQQNAADMEALRAMARHGADEILWPPGMTIVEGITAALAARGEGGGRREYLLPRLRDG